MRDGKNDQKKIRRVKYGDRGGTKLRVLKEQSEAVTSDRKDLRRKNRVKKEKRWKTVKERYTEVGQGVSNLSVLST